MVNRDESEPPQAQTPLTFKREELPYREGALGIVVDAQGRFLVVLHESPRITHQWRFPGGGVEAGETPQAAILREFAEEFGTDRFEIVQQSAQMNQVDYPDEAILEAYLARGKLWRGQRQHLFLLRFSGDPAELRPNPSEIRAIQWAPAAALPGLFVFPGQWEGVKPVLVEFFGAGIWDGE